MRVLYLRKRRKGDRKMGITISIHHAGGKANRGHNIRDERAIKNQTHIDKNRDIEIWRDETESRAYRRIFGASVKRYNEKQTREDRKIKSYLTEVKKNAKMYTSYECIVQIGNRDNQIDEQTERLILERFVKEWDTRNPNVDLYGVYYHKDEEGGRHLHLDYIPVAHGYKRGMDTQAGLAKALSEQGFVQEGGVTAQTQWQQRENQALEKICREFGLEVEHPMRDGKEKAREHLETEQYKATAQLRETIEAIEQNKEDSAYLQQKMEEKSRKVEELEQRITRKEEKLESLQGAVKEAKDLQKERKPHIWSRDKVTLDYAEYETLRKTARAVESLVEGQKQLEADKRALEEQKSQIKPELEQIAWEKRNLERREKKLEETIERCATARAKEMVSKILEKVADTYTQRLERFLQKFNINGISLFEKFKEEEERLHERAHRGFER